jgi:hypothetical protein
MRQDIEKVAEARQMRGEGRLMSEIVQARDGCLGTARSINTAWLHKVAAFAVR